MREEFIPAVTLICEAAASGKLKKAVLSKPSEKAVLRAELRPLIISGKLCLQTETFTSDNKAYHKNTDPADTEYIHSLLNGFSQINIMTSSGDCQISVTKKGKVLSNGVEKQLRSLSSGEAVEYGGNNRQKSRILNGSEKFLIRLGVSDANGRIYDKKQSKFRQINRFLEYVKDCVPHLRRDGALRVLDLCCGKSYLSFALYHYLTQVLGREVHMTGIDLKEDVIRECTEIAQDLGYTGLEFIAGDIRNCADTECDLVVSLHACDIATDIVLSTACRCNADVILSTPCCHHYLASNINCPELSFISDYPILGGKLCDAATDALRLAFLAKEGYEVSAFELIDPNETPKNVLLRGIRRKSFDKTSEEATALLTRFNGIEAFLMGNKEYEYLK